MYYDLINIRGMCLKFYEKKFVVSMYVSYSSIIIAHKIPDKSYAHSIMTCYSGMHKGPHRSSHRPDWQGSQHQEEPVQIQEENSSSVDSERPQCHEGVRTRDRREDSGVRFIWQLEEIVSESDREVYVSSVLQVHTHSEGTLQRNRFGLHSCLKFLLLLL